MKKIVINVIIALMSLATLWTLVFSGWAFVDQMNGWLWFDGIVFAFIIFGTSMFDTIAYLIPEEEV